MVNTIRSGINVISAALLVFLLAPLVNACQSCFNDCCDDGCDGCYAACGAVETVKCNQCYGCCEMSCPPNAQGPDDCTQTCYPDCGCWSGGPHLGTACCAGSDFCQHQGECQNDWDCPNECDICADVCCGQIQGVCVSGWEAMMSSPHVAPSPPETGNYYLYYTVLVANALASTFLASLIAYRVHKRRNIGYAAAPVKAKTK